MKKPQVIALSLALILPSAAALAGEKVCPEDAATCAHNMAEHFRQRGWVGINMNMGDETGEVMITDVLPNSPAEAAGLKENDVLKGLNGVAYSKENEQALKKEYEAFRPGSKAVFTVMRKGQELDIEVQLEKIPEAVLTQWIGQHVLDYHQADIDSSSDKDSEAEESP